VYKLRVNDTLYFYKILDFKNNLLYIKDSSGFFVYYFQSGILLNGIEPPNILKLYSFEFNEPQIISSFFKHKDSIKYLNKTLVLDSFLSPDKKSISNVKLFLSEDSFSIYRSIVSFDMAGMHQYEERILTSKQIDIPNIYDSISLNKQKIEIKLERNIQGSIQSLKDRIESIIGEQFNGDLIYQDLDRNVTRIDTSWKLYVIDYHYKSCYPCMLLSEDLNTLHEKYNSDGLKIYGINPIDPISNTLINFYRNKNVRYDIVIGSNSITDNFSAQSFPTIIILDSNFKIIKAWEGYDQTKLNELERFIIESIHR
jgi:thiol-disulfide isomerase/thioredoxin